jgi:ZIP family zinc transporter
VLEAAFWGLVGGFALVIGALIGLTFPTPQRVIGLIMGFGAGVLISALAFDLTEEAFRRGRTDAVAFGLAAGALTFYLGDRIIDGRGGEHRKRSTGQQECGSAKAIVLGALMDGIPESVAVGISLVGGGAVAAPMVVAVFLSNVSQSLSAATGLTKAGHSQRYVLGPWTAVMAVSGLAAAVGFQFLGELSADMVAAIQAFAAGAILTMLADTMMPEAFDYGGSAVGLITVLGFSLAFFLSATG